jgi:hypothetical protein
LLLVYSFHNYFDAYNHCLHKIDVFSLDHKAYCYSIMLDNKGQWYYHLFKVSYVYFYRHWMHVEFAEANNNNSEAHIRYAEEHIRDFEMNIRESESNIGEPESNIRDFETYIGESETYIRESETYIRESVGYNNNSEVYFNDYKD